MLEHLGGSSDSDMSPLDTHTASDSLRPLSPLEPHHRGVSTSNLYISSRQHHSSPSTPPKSSPVRLLKRLWQRCVSDCHCIAKTNSTSEPDELDYFFFLPSFCGDDDDVLGQVVPKLCEQVQTGSHSVKTDALRHIAHLCDRERAHNRIELVCSANQYHLIEILCKNVLQDPTISYQNYRQALLILSNLTLPMENKAILLLGPQTDTNLLQTLLDGLVMEKRKQQFQLEVHLVCAILYNLSFLPEGKPLLCNYGGSLDNPKSLLRTLEHLAVQFQPFVAPQGSVSSVPAPIASSVERQALRWTFGLVRNLCQDNADNARMIGQSTQIPQIALDCVAYSAQLCSSDALGKWKPQSLEDFALSLLVELALRDKENDPPCSDDNAGLVPWWRELKGRDRLEPLLTVGGIHGMRARAIVDRFDARDWNGNPHLLMDNTKGDANPEGKRCQEANGRGMRKPAIASV